MAYTKSSYYILLMLRLQCNMLYFIVESMYDIVRAKHDRKYDIYIHQLESTKIFLLGTAGIFFCVL